MVNSSLTQTVLIIEDDADMRKFASRVLELGGYHVLQVEDGKQGLKLAREGRVSLVLLDLRLPGNDGWAVLEQIKSEPELSAIPVVVLTASAAVSQRDRARNMGATDYLIKPLSANELAVRVRAALCRTGL